jgi:hypothetical protein
MSSLVKRLSSFHHSFSSISWKFLAARQESPFLLQMLNKDDDEHKRQMKANLDRYKDWICDERRMKLASKDVKYMHAMPADRGKEVTDEVIDNEKK